MNLHHCFRGFVFELQLATSPSSTSNRLSWKHPSKTPMYLDHSRPFTYQNPRSITAKLPHWSGKFRESRAYYGGHAKQKGKLRRSCPEILDTTSWGISGKFRCFWMAWLEIFRAESVVGSLVIMTRIPFLSSPQSITDVNLSKCLRYTEAYASWIPFNALSV